MIRLPAARNLEGSAGFPAEPLHPDRVLFERDDGEGILVWRFDHTLKGQIMDAVPERIIAGVVVAAEIGLDGAVLLQDCDYLRVIPEVVGGFRQDGKGAKHEEGLSGLVRLFELLLQPGGLLKPNPAVPALGLLLSLGAGPPVERLGF